MVPKFRAWDKDSKVMRSWKDLFLEKDGGEDFWLIGYKENACITSFDHDQILMQSTGLKDKNGVEVFQGDIVKCTSGCPHEVVWLKEYAGMYVGGMPAWYLSGLNEGYAWIGKEEVMGNIFENPELLEQANE
ncbi:YopX family protein [Enterococcus casseliflavus]|uniref:YopX family protein n=1 Tax=Enterococcus casseliflavus TaxID=37734 RepID=UPI003D0E5AD9